ncbi:LptF/LptG family permease [Blattabacterium cuenoti]|uniref:LptF/LptG family permease n=1 Tax=Blattabacterium cuenoti TaxID=1653831 RepID=UPI00163CE6FE|nr:LptF/LptG family permease [Blattabacterium cuenoti]
MKILDRYLIKNFIKYFIFFTISIQIICIIMDLTQRIHKLENNNSSIKEALIYYYPFWSIWLINTFSSISFFLSVIFFTSKITKRSEITTILSNGISFNRLAIIYLIFASVIGLISLLINYYVLPITNKKKNKFHYQYLINYNKKLYGNNKYLTAKIDKNRYLFVKNFSKANNIGNGCVYEIFYNEKLIYLLKSKYIFWSKKKKHYIVYNYKEIFFKKNYDLFKEGLYKILKISSSPDELSPDVYFSENMSITELNKIIKKNKNDKNIYLNEYHKRIILPFSILIFTILGLSISSNRKNNLGNNMIIGIIIIFSYIFLMEIINILSLKNYISSYFIWIPNLITFIFTIFIYYKRNNE